MIYDSHCHLDLLENIPLFLKEIDDSNIKLFAVGTTPKAYVREKQFCRNISNIHVGLGLHPQLVSSGYDDIQLFESLVEKCHYIGEIGLDFSKNYNQTKELQIIQFSEIIGLCEKFGEKVVSIHSLKSTNTVIDILRKNKKQNNNIYIFHWFTGTITQLQKAVEMGCYFSINHKMLTTKSGIETIKHIPVERMLIETDAPFALNVQHIDDIRSELENSLLSISDILGFDVSEIIYNNSKEVFSY